MSHFSVFVLTQLCADDPNISEERWQEVAANKLRPFQENNMEDCPKEFLQFFDKENEYLQKYENESVEMVVVGDKLLYPHDDQFGALEAPEHLERRQVAHKKYYATFEKFCKDWYGAESRDPEKGRYGYWENPNAKWDWWQIGGRWTAAWDKSYDPKTDPENQEICWLCQGTGERKDMNCPNGCNACNGKGIQIKWPTSWKSKPDSNIFPLSKVLPDILDDSLHVPFAIITPDGKWNEAGEMGWWGIVKNEKDDWKEQAKQILTAHKNCTAIVVDCHI